jgi:tripartite-type tricarboxylate transporter receptor subunit TctC
MLELPTISESGVPGFDAGSWIGIAAPAGISPAIIDKISADVKAVLSDQETRQSLIQQGATPLPLSPAAFKARIDSDRQRYAKVIKDGNVQID